MRCRAASLVPADRPTFAHPLRTLRRAARGLRTPRSDVGQSPGARPAPCPRVRRLVPPLAAYFVVAYAVSWAFWAPAVLAQTGWIAPVPSRYLHLLGGLGPMLAAIALTARISGRAALANLARRCVTGGPWLAVALLIPAALFVLAAVIVSVGYGEAIDWRNVGRSTELPELPRPAYWLATLVFYGFGEEVGWRGFALPRLRLRASALRASVVLAFAWAGWHLPLFVFADGLSSLGPAGAAGWFVSLVLGSILLTWLFEASAGSVGAVALFHASLDIFITSPVTAGDEIANVMGALLTVGALGLATVMALGTATRRQERNVDAQPGMDSFVP
jgi:uncharacterized protein